MKILSVFGTRPEAIKMAPLLKTLETRPDAFQSTVCVTAQHRQMLDQVLNLFGIVPEFDLDIMRPGQDLFDVTSQVLGGLKEIFRQAKPDLVLVHGDTTTAMAAALAAYYQQIPVGHVEAGLRTGNIYAPFPEEVNRRVVGCLAAIHFAPTIAAMGNLLREGVEPSRIHVTGNTVVDALLHVVSQVRGAMADQFSAQFSFLDPARRLILVTGHRRENFGAGMESICKALAEIAAGHSDVEIIYPVHLNPNVREPVNRILQDVPGGRIHLVEPVDYAPFIYLMDRAHFVLTDSGGIQEEAPCIGKPVLLMRETTERPEAVAAGGVLLVGTNKERIVQAAEQLLGDPRLYDEMSGPQRPFGDGTASRQIVEILSQGKVSS